MQWFSAWSSILTGDPIPPAWNTNDTTDQADVVTAQDCPRSCMLKDNAVVAKAKNI